jgi:L-aspartate oxidase
MLDTARYLLPTMPREVLRHRVPVLVVGGGLAGLSAALEAARFGDVLLLTKAALPASNSAWAQGGIAAALDPHDSPQAHIEDTLMAGAGLCDRAAVTVLAHEAPGLMRELARLGVPFDRQEEDAFALGLEGGHSRRRIVHVGDATGLAVTQALIAQVRAQPNIRVWEGVQAVDLLGGPGAVSGLLALDPLGHWHCIDAGSTVLASGGAGALFGLTSNQPGALGDGIALAYRAGAEIADMEFVQFHPTVYRTQAGQGFLITEAARGEGGQLLTVDGERFMPGYDARAELAPRDIVTRGIYAAMQRSGADHVLLDLTHLPRATIESHFPTICARLRAEGLDPVVTPIPVAPASHYLMGGIRTDLHGATSLRGLYAAGECTCTGVHGANRLASNSLLECLVFGRRAGVAAGGRMPHEEFRSALVSPIAASEVLLTSSSTQTIDGPIVDLYVTEPPMLGDLAQIMREAAGPLRHGDSLRTALPQLRALERATRATARFGIQDSGFRSLSASQRYGTSEHDHIDQLHGNAAASIARMNALQAAQLIVGSALLREESRGGHFRSDFPEREPSWELHTVLRRDAQPGFATTIAAERALGKNSEFRIQDSVGRCER